MAKNFPAFKTLYRDELDANLEAQADARRIIQQSQSQTVTLLYGAKDPQINHAVVLRDYLEEKASEE